jgi:hypothetical protein
MRWTRRAGCGSDFEGEFMHVMTITTKFALGDVIRFDSVYGKGTGRVFAITVKWDKSTEYLIEIDMGHYCDLLPGIVDTDITENLSSGDFAAMNQEQIASKYTFGDVIHFDSINGKGTGIVYSIMIDVDKCISYVVKIKGFSDLQPGIFESEVLEKVGTGEIANK